MSPMLIVSMAWIDFSANFDALAICFEPTMGELAFKVLYLEASVSHF